MNPNQKLIDSLREAADFLEARPELPRFFHDVDLRHYIAGPVEEQRKLLADYARKLSPVEKSFLDGSNLFRLVKQLPWGALRIIADREAVCRKVETKKLIPAKPERTLPAEPEREEVEVEWVCSEPLLAERESVEA